MDKVHRPDSGLSADVDSATRSCGHWVMRSLGQGRAAATRGDALPASAINGCLRRVDPNPRPGVVHVALGIPQWTGVFWLRSAGGIPCPGDEFRGSRREVQHGAPLGPGPTVGVPGGPNRLAIPVRPPDQLRLSPAPPAVGRHVDPDDASFSAREGVPGDFGGAGGDGLPVVGREDVRVERHRPQGQRVIGAGRAGIAVGRQQSVGNGLEVVLRRGRARRDPVDPLDAAGADVAGHDHSDRCAVRGGQRLAVHLPRQQHLAAHRFVDLHRSAERLGRVGDLGDVGGAELDVRGLRLHPDGGQHVAQPRSGPLRRAGRARSPERFAGHVADLGEAGPPVARALQGRGQRVVLEFAAQLRERDLRGLVDLAVDGQPPGADVRVRDVAVVAAVERLDRRAEAFW